jgi:hypothetical protein
MKAKIAACLVAATALMSILTGCGDGDGAVDVDRAQSGDTVKMTYEIWCHNRREAESLYAAGLLAESRYEAYDTWNKVKANLEARKNLAHSTATCFYPRTDSSVSYTMVGKTSSGSGVAYEVSGDGETWWVVK